MQNQGAWKTKLAVACVLLFAACGDDDTMSPTAGMGASGKGATSGSGAKGGTGGSTGSAGKASSGSGGSATAGRGTAGAGGAGGSSAKATAMIMPFGSSSGSAGSGGSAAGGSAAGSGGSSAAGSSGSAGSGATGLSGTATFTGTGTSVKLEISVMNCADGSYPVHIHDGTSCADAMAQGGHWGMMTASAAGSGGSSAAGSGGAAGHAGAAGGSSSAGAGGTAPAAPVRGEGIPSITCTGNMGTTMVTRDSTDPKLTWTVGGEATTNVVGHVIVVHDSTGKRVACGKITMP